MNILFMGKPGSGKGTITQSLEGDFIQFSTGDLLRQEQERDTELGKEIGRLLAGGNFATDAMIFDLVDNFLEANNGKSIVFDGFPRNTKQAEECIKRGIVFDHVFLIDVSDEVVKERIVNRRVHLPSGRVYNTKTRPPKIENIDDVTGEALTHRNDDHEHVLDQRLRNFHSLTEPVMDVLVQAGYKINVINGETNIDDQVKIVKDMLSNHNIKKIKL